MKEIGGYFGLEELAHREYYPDLIAVNSARNALVYLLRAKNIRKIYIPYYLCDTVSAVCEREGFDFSRYEVDKNFLPIWDRRLDEDEYLYLVNYFGQLSHDKILELQDRYHNVIVDNVQAFFQKPVHGMDTIYSCRKFFGVPDGGYVATEARLTEPLTVDVSRDRMRHILGRYEESASAFYGDFRDNDESFYDLELRAMSKLTHNILGAIDYDAVKSRREQNFACLHDCLGKRNPLALRIPEGPFAYPFYAENGPEIRKNLAEKRIYIPTLWPDAIPFGGLARDYSENILPIPCDQRYTEEDMKFTAEEIKKCMSI